MQNNSRRFTHRPLYTIWLLVVITLSCSHLSAQTVFNCSSGFTSSGACGVSGVTGGGSGTPFGVFGSFNGTTPTLSSGTVTLLTSGASHAALSMNYQTKVNVQAFTASFTFVPNGQNVSLIFNNTNNQTFFNGSSFSSGAGCEADFFQAFYSPAPGPPNNVFALELDNYSPLLVSNPFTYTNSSAQIYSAGTSPCIPNDSGNTFPQINKISTSPISMNSPASTQNTTTGHTYSASVGYDGSNFSLCLYDVTAANGSCSSSTSGTGTFFQHTWTGVNIPSIVGASTAWVGMGGASGSLVPPAPLTVSAFSYSVTPTLTLTATHETMEQGQPVPPLIYTASPSLAGLGCTGSPSISTTATSASTPGNYTTTISAGSLACSGYTLAFNTGTMAVIAADGNGAQINNSVSYPSGFFGGATNPVLNATSNGVCNMVGDGVTDNTSCLNTLNDRYMVTNCSTQPSQVNYLYFPTGTYLFTGQISPCGNGWTYWGDGPQKTIFRLAPNTYTSTNTQWFNPSSVNTASNFREYIYNIGFDVGYGNPNAIPMTALMNNSGALRNVLIWVEDSVCPEGLNLSRALAGPALAKNVGIYGCADAIYSNQSEYNFTFDQITLEGQTAQAVDSTGYNWAMQHVLSDNTVPFYLGRSIGTAASLAILDSELLNGASGNTAIRQTSSGGIVYERGVTMTGYGTAISDANGSTQTAMPPEYWSGTAQCVFCSTPGSLRLPEQETPNPTDDPTISDWVNLGTNGANFASEISGSASVTAYAPPGTITGTGTYAITVPDTVNHLIFNNSLTASQNPKFTLTVAGVSSTPLVIDGCPYAVCNIIHTGSRTVVVRDSYLNGYAPSSGAGNFFAEDIVTNGGSNTTSTEFWPSQNVWARQLNIENKTQTNQFVCNGAKLWFLGYKTENNATISGGNPSNVEQNGCQAEIFGHFYYPLTATGTGFQTTLANSSLWDTGITFVPGANQGWPNLYQDTQATTGNTPTVSQSATQWTPAFYSYGAALWNGILAPARADLNWKNAGDQTIPSSIPANCSTQPSAHTLSALNTAIGADVGGGSFCTIDATNWGTLSGVSGSIVVDYAGPANVFINGTGTKFAWTGATSSNCNGLSGTNLCAWNGDSSSPSEGGWANKAAISSGLTQGSTTIVLANDTNLKVGSIIQLAQKDPSSDNGNAYPCATTSASSQCSQQGGSSQSSIGGVNASLTQMTTIASCGTSTFGAACTSTTVTLNDPIKATNWNNSFSPTAQWPNTLPLSNVVIQGLAIDVSATTAHLIVECHMCKNVAFSGVSTINGLVTGQSATNHYIIWGSSHVTIQHGYMYGSNPASQGYGIDWDAGTSDGLGLNMISQKIATGYITETGVGNVYAYNYAVDNYFGSNWQQCDEALHSAGDIFNLFEGNIGICGGGDDIHGSHFFNTWYRNRLSGFDPATDADGPRTNNIYTYSDMAFSRYNNLVANVLGTSGKNTTYQLIGSPSNTSCSGAGNNNLYQFDFGDQNNRFYSSSSCGDSPAGTINNDANVQGSVMRWGNWDVVNGSVQENSSETASTASTYPGLASPATTFPASFVFSSQPSWWVFPSGTTAPWPGIGPDVTGGNISGVGGFAYLNPAANCYLNVLGGGVTGSTGPLNFSQSACYTATTPTAATPTFSPASPYTGGNTSVSISSSTSGATLTYCTSNAGACTPGTAYTGAISFTSSGPTNICAFANASGFLQSATACWAGTFSLPTCADPAQAGPNFSGSYNVPPTTLPLNVLFTESTSGCVMHYTTDGSVPTLSSPTFPGGGLNISSTTTVRTIAIQSGYNSSNIVGGTWTLNITPPPPSNLVPSLVLMIAETQTISGDFAK